MQHGYFFTECVFVDTSLMWNLCYVLVLWYEWISWTRVTNKTDLSRILFNANPRHTMICSALWWQDPPLQQRCYWRGMMAQSICCCMSKFLNRLIRRARFLFCPTIAIFLARNPSARCKNNFEGHVLDSYELRVCSETHRVTSSKFGKWWLRFDCPFFMIQSFFWQRATEALNQIDASTASSEMTSFSKIWPSVGEGNGEFSAGNSGCGEPKSRMVGLLLQKRPVI